MKAIQPPPEVRAVFETWPEDVRARIMEVRRQIIETAAREGVGPITETLKWGEPAYLTEATKAGTTIRLGWKPKSPDSYALYFNCRTTIVATIRDLFQDEFRFEGNRAVILDASDDPAKKPVGACIAMALTYHRDKRQGGR